MSGFCGKKNYFFNSISHKKNIFLPKVLAKKNQNPLLQKSLYI
jgi:ribosomal protein L28